MNTNQKMVAHFNTYSLVTSLVVVGLGLAGMLDWLMKAQLLSVVQSDHPTMKFNTALCFVLSGITLIGIHRAKAWQWRVLTLLGALAVLVIATATLLEIGLHRNFGIDELVIRDPIGHGRMNNTTVVGFTVIGLALVWLTRRPTSRTMLQLGVLMLFMTSTLSALGVWLPLKSGAGGEPFATVSPLTVIGLALVSSALLTYQMDNGLLQVIVSDSPGGVMMRRLSVGTMVVVTFTGWTSENLITFPVVGLDFAFHSATLIVAALILEWRLSSRMDRIEAERKAALADLQEQRQLYYNLFEGVNDAITLHDLEGHILEVNEAAVRRLGYSRDELLHMKTTDLDEPEYGSHFGDRVTKQAADGMLNDILGAHIAKDGHKIPIHVNSRVIAYKGQPAVLAVVRDISALLQAERDAVDLALERERSRILAHFIRDASHEFRTPLTILATNLELIPRIQDEAKRTTYIRRSHDQIMQITKLISQLVLIVELENEDRFEFQSVSITRLFDRLKTQMTKQAPARPIHFEIGPECPPMIFGDEELLYIALLELVDNAVRYSADSSSVRVQALRHHHAVALTITDQGTGIDPQQQKLIFNRFYQHDQAHTTPGFGLGLPIAKLIVEGHRGQIEVESQVGKGSTFRVILPAFAEVGSIEASHEGSATVDVNGPPHEVQQFTTTLRPHFDATRGWTIPYLSRFLVYGEGFGMGLITE